jgi:DNA-binding LacI/PurR family transcriptional regulator
MAKIRTLFGKKLLPHHMLNFSEQLYDILVAEIELGRWQINDRLPGVIQLAKELDFGTKTIQSTYDRLKKDGYVKALGYRGTFLKSRHPQAASAAGKIGVLVSPDQTEDPLTLWYQHVILQNAKKQNLVSETKVLPVHLAASEINRRGQLFCDDVLGIISLTPWHMPVRFGDTDGTIPVVFLLPPFEAGVPKICADIQEAYYELTSRVIRYGHRRVIFSEDSIEPDPRQTEMHRAGYVQAMRENGLEVDEPLIRASQAVNNQHLPSVVSHLQEILKNTKNLGPVAVVCGSLGRAMAMTKAALAEGIRVPEDLGIVSIGSAPVDGDASQQTTGMLPDFDAMTEMCMQLLRQQRDKGRSEFTEVRFRMHFVRGSTLACHGPDPFLIQDSMPENILRHDPQTLSLAVNTSSRKRKKST